jgi:hypothetical protein
VVCDLGQTISKLSMRDVNVSVLLALPVKQDA